MSESINDNINQNNDEEEVSDNESSTVSPLNSSISNASIPPPLLPKPRKIKSDIDSDSDSNINNELTYDDISSQIGELNILETSDSVDNKKDSSISSASFRNSGFSSFPFSNSSVETPVYINPGRVHGNWISPLVPSSPGPLSGSPHTQHSMTSISNFSDFSASPSSTNLNLSPSNGDFSSSNFNDINTNDNILSKKGNNSISSISVSSTSINKPRPLIHSPSPAALLATTKSQQSISSTASESISPTTASALYSKKQARISELLEDIPDSSVIPNIISENEISITQTKPGSKDDNYILKRSNSEVIQVRDKRTSVQEQYRQLIKQVGTDGKPHLLSKAISNQDTVLSAPLSFVTPSGNNQPSNILFASQNSSGGSKILIPERTDSKNPMNAKCFSELSPDEWIILQTAALTRFNILARKYRIKPLPSEFLKTLSLSIYGTTDKKKWWAKFKKDAKDGSGAEIVPRSIVKAPIVISVEYASVPYATSLSDVDAVRRVPIVVHECTKLLRTRGLKEKGIFRVNGSEKRIAQVFALFDQPPHFGLNANCEQFTVFDVADFLKRYLRQLPEPLLTSEMYDSFLRCLDVPLEGGIRIRALRLLLIMLPPPHLIILESLLALFSEVVKNCEENSMTSNSIARIFSPNFLKPTKGKEQALEEYDLCTQVVETLIDYWDHFIITSDQIRPYQLLDVTYASMAEFITMY